MRTGGPKPCANEMQNFASDDNKEIPKKKPLKFPWFCGLQEYDFRTPSCVHFGVLFFFPLRDVKKFVFLIWKEAILEARCGVLIWRTRWFIWSWGYLYCNRHWGNPWWHMVGNFVCFWYLWQTSMIDIPYPTERSLSASGNENLGGLYGIICPTNSLGCGETRIQTKTNANIEPLSQKQTLSLWTRRKDIQQSSYLFHKVETTTQMGWNWRQVGENCLLLVGRGNNCWLETCMHHCFLFWELFFIFLARHHADFLFEIWTCGQCPTVLFKICGFLLSCCASPQSRMSWCTSSEFDAQNIVWWWQQKTNRTESNFKKSERLCLFCSWSTHVLRHLGLNILRSPHHICQY
jgi:hypothetical protein